jgi:hypothetical protein
MTINPLDSHVPIRDFSQKALVEYILQWIQDHPGGGTTTIRKAGVDVGTRAALNFIEGANVTITAVDDSGNGEVDITIASTGGGGGGGSGGTILLPNILAPIDPRLMREQVALGVGGYIMGVRVVIPTTGTLHDLSVFVTGGSGGTVDAGLYSTAGTRSRLYHTGALACPANGVWTILADPNLSVVEGEQYDFAITFTDGPGFAGMSLAAFPGGHLPVGFEMGQAALAKVAWYAANPDGVGTTLPSTLAETDLNDSNLILGVIAHITPSASPSTAIPGGVGPPGMPGQDGEDGESWMIPGPPGAGTQGIQGNPGSPGAAGPAGAMGPWGADGEDGLDFIVPGPAGKDGAAGTPGAAGAAGSPGAPGPWGADGEDGIDFLFPGPAGAKGDQGIQGVQGNPGTAGTVGPAGAPGPWGADGEDGVDFIMPGPVGATGVAGSPGAPGVAGPAGPMGMQGDPGDDGDTFMIPGPAGAPGAAGAGGTATTVEKNLSATAVNQGNFTITDAAIQATDKVLVTQAPGPYTSKGTLADESTMDQIVCVAVPAAGSAKVYWTAVSRGVGFVRGNFKFTYQRFA